MSVACVGVHVSRHLKERMAGLQINCFGLLEYQAHSQEGSVGSEEPPSQRKVHFSKIRSTFLKRSTVITTPYRDIGIGPADSAAAKLKFHPQLKVVLIN